MATDWTYETRRTSEKTEVLQAANSDTSIYLSDQNFAQFGTNRRSEIAGIIGNTGQDWEKLYNDYLDSL